MLKIKRLSEVIGKRVYSDSGDKCGFVEEINLVDNRIDSWRIVVSKDTDMGPLLGGARGIIVPQQFIKAVGDVIVISRNAVPAREEEEIAVDEEETI